MDPEIELRRSQKMSKLFKSITTRWIKNDNDETNNNCQ